MNRFIKTTLCAAVMTCGLSLSSVSSAVPIIGAGIYVEHTGEVIATFLGTDAAFSNDLYLDSPISSGIIFNNHTTPIGTTVSLGTFAAGTELIFKIHVNDTGDDFFSGLASRNADGQFHAIVDDAYSATETYVGFEDLPGGGGDFNDVQFSFSNVRSNPVPEPTTAFLLGAGLVAGAVLRRTRKQS